MDHVQVFQSLESPRAVCDCMAALVQGDLGAKRSAELTHADNLLPLSPSGELLCLWHLILYVVQKIERQKGRTQSFVSLS